ncbi:hypothetical protein [Paucibacter sp. KCTC 42545]|uniref:hypothetical protein n=1 Tax=Paucibacter sp. KCTC 42545 TaxID=1768242 RepID=UPI0012E3900D|nr:hypothetical protein [Paucibacter sp. KCTC 42545]
MSFRLFSTALVTALAFTSMLAQAHELIVKVEPADRSGNVSQALNEQKVALSEQNTNLSELKAVLKNQRELLAEQKSLLAEQGKTLSIQRTELSKSRSSKADTP